MPVNFNNVSPRDFEMKNKDALIHWAYYGYRDVNKRPLVTICLIAEVINGTKPEFLIHRGVSICGPKDNPFINYGKAKAFARAKDAMFLKGKFIKNRLKQIRRAEAIKTLEACNCLYLIDQFKGQYNVSIDNLIPYEKELINSLAEDYKNK